jgi:hypothetical protein
LTVFQLMLENVQMKYGWQYAMLAVALVAASAGADTVYLKNGVEFDGVVTPVADNPGIFKVTAGDRSLTYRAEEIDRVEKNEKTGKLSKEEILASWEEQNRVLTEETGLTAEQRGLVMGLMFELKTDNVSKRVAVREKLIGLQKEFDAYNFLANQLPGVSILIGPNLLEALAYMDSSRALELLQGAAENNYFGTRAMAIELLGRLGNAGSKDLIVRGLADHKQEVQISAVYVLAGMGAREVTPALISLLPSPDERVSNASREALLALWANAITDPKPGTVDEWTTFWNTQEKSGTPVQLADLKALSNPEEEIVSSIDTNHSVGSGADTAVASEG